MLLCEILNIEYLPVEWIQPDVGEFFVDDVKYGIIFENLNIRLPTRTVIVVNISFGNIIDNNQPISSSNINRGIKHTGKPRTVLSTVGNACAHNSYIKNFDMIVVAASDQVKEKRIGIYTLALSELLTLLPEYQYDYTAKTPNGSLLAIQSRVQLTQQETNYIGKQILMKDS